MYGDKIATYGTKNPEHCLHTDIKLVMNNLICTVTNLVNIVAAPSKKSHSLKTSVLRKALWVVIVIVRYL